MESADDTDSVKKRLREEWFVSKATLLYNSANILYCFLVVEIVDPKKLCCLSCWTCCPTLLRFVYRITVSIWS